MFSGQENIFGLPPPDVVVRPVSDAFDRRQPLPAFLRVFANETVPDLSRSPRTRACRTFQPDSRWSGISKEAIAKPFRHGRHGGRPSLKTHTGRNALRRVRSERKRPRYSADYRNASTFNQSSAVGTSDPVKPPTERSICGVCLTPLKNRALAPPRRTT